MKKIRFQLVPTVTIPKSRLQVKRNPAKNRLPFAFDYNEGEATKDKRRLPIYWKGAKNEQQSNTHLTKTRPICQAKSGAEKVACLAEARRALQVLKIFREAKIYLHLILYPEGGSVSSKTHPKKCTRLYF